MESGGDYGRGYKDALKCLESLQSNRAVAKMVTKSNRDMNLDAIPEMLDWVRKAGYDAKDFNELKVIHVAGTKGKGSVSAIVASILQQYSQQFQIKGRPDVGKVGLYTSPHLITVRERIRIDGEPISQSLFTEYFFTLWDRFTAVAEKEGHRNPGSAKTKPGYFRFLTIMAFHAFLQQGVKTAVVECGIGGEYDSTNILTKEAVTVSAITALGMDHVGMLGDTIEKIAWHKAGIMKEGVKCFTVIQEPEAMEVLETRAKEKNTTLEVVSRNPQIESGDVQISLEGDFQKDNASLAIALTAAHLESLGHKAVLLSSPLPTEFLHGLAYVVWDGRCQVHREATIDWHLDGAHTTASINAAAAWFAPNLLARPTSAPTRASQLGHAMLLFNQQERDSAALVRALHFALERETSARHLFSNAVFCTNALQKPDEAVFFSGQVDAQWRAQRQAADAWAECEPDTEIEVYFSVEEAVAKVREVAAERAEGSGEHGERLLVLVTGSLHLVGAVLRVLRGGED